MKKLFIIIGIVMSSNIFAANAELYDVLNVKESLRYGNDGVMRLQKSLKGIKCLKEVVGSDLISVACDVKIEEVDAKELYNVLLVEEEVLNSSGMYEVKRKTVEALSCTRIADVREGTTYSCLLEL